jgi:hypothetical protein
MERETMHEQTAGFGKTVIRQNIGVVYPAVPSSLTYQSHRIDQLLSQRCA